MIKFSNNIKDLKIVKVSKNNIYINSPFKIILLIFYILYNSKELLFLYYIVKLSKY